MSRVDTIVPFVARHRIPLARSAAGIWALVIFALSSISDPGVPSGMTTPGHAVLYFVLGALLTLSGGRMPPTSRMVALAVLVASAYGISDEFHQAFVPGRVPDVADWATDTVGAAVGALATAWLARMRTRS